MGLVDLYIRWKISRQLKSWNKLRHTHFYIDGKGKIKTVNV